VPRPRFTLSDAAATGYRSDAFQPLYFVSDSLDDAAAEFKPSTWPDCRLAGDGSNGGYGGGDDRRPVAREYRTGSDPRTLRDALGCFATGVTVVTCLDTKEIRRASGQQLHLAQLDPPLLLVVAKAAASAGPLSEAEHFAVNVLRPASSRRQLPFRPASRTGSAAPWALGAWRSSADGFVVGVRVRAPRSP
jgi:hypothetical protein